MAHEPSRWCLVRALVRGEELVVRSCRFVDEVAPRAVVEEGAASAEWRDAGDEVLAAYRLRVTTSQAEAVDGVAGAPVAHVTGAVPGHPEAASLRLAVGSVATVVELSQRAPSLTVMEPGSGASEQSTVRVGWITDDPVAEPSIRLLGAGHPLPLGLLHLSDDGSEVDLAGAAGEELWLEVTLTRGVRSTVEVVGPFARPAPTAAWFVLTPSVGSSFPEGSTVELHADRVGLGAGEVLSDRPVTWHSSIDGAVAEGVRAAVVLGVGEHVLEVRRGDDVLASTRVSIETPA